MCMLQLKQISVNTLRAKMDKKKILIVDDSPDILEFTKRLLETRGYAVTVLEDGKDILAKVKALLPQLIILDMFLPNTTGLDICQEIKSDAALSQIPVLITTGHLHEEESAIIHASVRPDAYLSKPFELDDLLATIKKYIN